MKTNIVGAPKGIGTEALHIGVVSKRLEWLEQQMDETPPFKQAYNNLNERHGRLIEAKNILDKEGLWL
jgi:hypothetical protein